MTHHLRPTIPTSSLQHRREAGGEAWKGSTTLANSTLYPLGACGSAGSTVISGASTGPCTLVAGRALRITNSGELSSSPGTQIKGKLGVAYDAMDEGNVVTAAFAGAPGQTFRTPVATSGRGCCAGAWSSAR